MIRMGRNAKEYALYKGETMLAIGTVNEIADEIGVKPETVHFYSSPTYQKRGSGKNRKVLVALDESEDE